MVDDEGDGEAVEDGGRGSGEMASTRSSEEEPMARRGSRERGKLVGLGAGARVVLTRCAARSVWLSLNQEPPIFFHKSPSSSYPLHPHRTSPSGESASGGRVGALEEGLGDPGGGGVPAVVAVEYGGQGRGVVVGEDVGGDGGEVHVGEGDDDQVVGGDARWER